MEIRHPIDTRLPPWFAGSQVLRCIFVGMPSPGLVEMCAYAGFDFVIVDNEHGSADLQTTEHMLRAARAAGVPAVVRCLEHDIARVLDLGACGVQIPMVRDAAHAADLVQRIRYPLPGGRGGRRGSAFSTRAAGYGAFGGAGHTALSNEGVAFIPMIETPEAVEQAQAIAAVDGVNAVFVGPNDLAHAMGHENRWSDPPVLAAIERAVRAVASAGKCPGTLALSPADRERCDNWGVRMQATVLTGVLMQALKEAAGGRGVAVRY